MNGNIAMSPALFPTRRALVLGALAAIALAAARTALADESGDPATLQGGEWRVSEIGGEAVAEDWPVTIAFGDDGAYSGRACNTFRGAYMLEGASLSLGPAAATRMACQEPAMAQEHALFDALERVAGFALQPDGTLRLTDAAGNGVIAARR